MQTKTGYRVVAAAAGFVFLWHAFSSAQTKQTNLKDDSQAIAVYLYRFTKYIEWPLQPKSKPFVFGFYGYSPVVRQLLSNTEGKTVNGRKIEIKIFNDIEDITGCHVLYISSYQPEELKPIDSMALSKKCLTVMHSQKQGVKKACIDFLNVPGSINFQIDKKRIARYGLKVSDELIKMAVPEKK